MQQNKGSLEETKKKKKTLQKWKQSSQKEWGLFGL